MPCDCSHLEASNFESEMSKVACLLDEFDGKPIDKTHWNGYHPAVYNKTIDGDTMIAELCSRLQAVDVKEYSLEMQMWWRDHQQRDKAKLEYELNRKKTEEEKKAALEKLTEYERKLLGLN